MIDDFLASWIRSDLSLSRSLIHWFPTGVENRTACNRRAAAYFDGFQVEPGSKLTSMHMCQQCLHRVRVVNAGRRPLRSR